MLQFIDPGTYYKIVFRVRGKTTGPGIYFPTWDKANTYLQERVIVRHPDATIVPVEV